MVGEAENKTNSAQLSWGLAELGKNVSFLVLSFEESTKTWYIILIPDDHRVFSKAIPNFPFVGGCVPNRLVGQIGNQTKSFKLSLDIQQN